ncbi:MAG: class I SAM-dependent methyltransferase [Chitinophagaceae bacterium]|nr:class I SAM-dependent methyltransferase [Chitinophagaceae bacterium]
MINNYKTDFFVELKLRECGFSLYAVRRSLLRAVTELKAEISGRVLDLACGVMPYKEYLQENKNITHYIGVDLPPTEYHNAVKPDFFWNGKDLPFEDESFDYVIATEFFEHYHDTKSVLIEIKRVLKKGGKLFFTVPSLWPIHEAPYDAHRFTYYGLETNFQEVGFSSYIIKSLGGHCVSLAIMLGLWHENSLKRIYQQIIYPFVWVFYKYLISRDDLNSEFKNGTFHSGLFGFVVK